jgi:hypothetical protein
LKKVVFGAAATHFFDQLLRRKKSLLCSTENKIINSDQAPSISTKNGIFSRSAGSDPDTHWNEKLNTDPHESRNSLASKAQNGAVEGRHNGSVETQNVALEQIRITVMRRIRKVGSRSAFKF